jgi:hypothetical protein
VGIYTTEKTVSDPIHFDKRRELGPEYETLDIDKSAHGILRKAIRCCNTEDTIVLPIECAMDLISEWDARREIDGSLLPLAKPE